MVKYILYCLPILLYANEQNSTIKTTVNKDKNSTKITKKDINNTKNELLQKHIKEQMEREAKYAKEKMFYIGKDYNLTEHQVDPETVKKITPIEPDYDFNMDEGVYSD